MQTLSITGSLIKKNEKQNIESKDGKKWVKQTFLINTGTEYNNEICFQLFGEEKMDSLMVFRVMKNHGIKLLMNMPPIIFN